MVSKIIIALCVITIVTALPPPQARGGWEAAAGANYLPPWIALAPWYQIPGSQWYPCDPNGNFCIDCSTKFECTKIGGLQKACTDPALPHCNLGVCSATPSEECAVPLVPDYAD